MQDDARNDDASFRRLAMARRWPGLQEHDERSQNRIESAAGLELLALAEEELDDWVRHGDGARPG